VLVDGDGLLMWLLLLLLAQLICEFRLGFERDLHEALQHAYAFVWRPHCLGQGLVGASKPRDAFVRNRVF
jgi:hypothetical protein